MSSKVHETDFSGGDPYHAHVLAASGLEAAGATVPDPDGTRNLDADNLDYGNFPQEADLEPKSPTRILGAAGVSEHKKNLRRAIRNLNREMQI